MGISQGPWSKENDVELSFRRNRMEKERVERAIMGVPGFEDSPTRRERDVPLGWGERQETGFFVDENKEMDAYNQKDTVVVQPEKPPTPIDISSPKHSVPSFLDHPTVIIPPVPAVVYQRGMDDEQNEGGTIGKSSETVKRTQNSLIKFRNAVDKANRISQFQDASYGR